MYVYSVYCHNVNNLLLAQTPFRKAQEDGERRGRQSHRQASFSNQAREPTEE